MKKPTVQPWHPAPYEPADEQAVKALVAGVANQFQQQRAMDWIVRLLCGTYDLSFRPGADGERETAFAEGKRFVGLQIVKLANIHKPAPSLRSEDAHPILSGRQQGSL